MIVKAYRMCGRLDNDYPVCDLLSDVLSNGRSSRLFRNVYAKGNLVASIDASITGDEDPGMLIVKAQLLPGVSFDRVEAAIADELRKVADGDVSQYELDKVVNKYESNALFSNLNNDELASNLAYFEMLGNAEMINEEVERYRATTLGEWQMWHRLCLRSRIAPLCIIRREIVDKKWEYTLSCFSEKLLLL